MGSSLTKYLNKSQRLTRLSELFFYTGKDFIMCYKLICLFATYAVIVCHLVCNSRIPNAK
jgi:hypothetical protein